MTPDLDSLEDAQPAPAAAESSVPAPPLDAAYWEDCYRRGDTRWDKGAPAPGLVDFLKARPHVTSATVCVPGCGTGSDLLPWAKAGFQVTGVDIAPSAVRLATQRSHEANASMSVLQADFLNDTPPAPFDWIWEHTLFCAIHPSQRIHYVDALLRWLKPRGTYLAVNYLVTEDDEGPPFGTTPEELRRWLEPQFHLRDSWIPRSYPNRTGHELMMWWERRS